MRYKTQLVSQDFSQRPVIDHEQTYSTVVDGTTFRYLISLAIYEELDLHVMNVVTAYLYGSLDSDIYTKIPEEFKMLETCNLGYREHYSIKLNKSLSGLKQS